MSRSELAEAVNAWLWRSTGQRYDLDGHHIAKYERGAVRFPIAAYRAGLRAVLGASDDAELGFVTPRRRGSLAMVVTLDGAWSPGGIVDEADEAVRFSMLNRRDALGSGVAASGAALLAPLAGWLEPLTGWADRPGPTFGIAEVEALERAVELPRQWRSAPGLGPAAVVGQLHEVTDRLRGAGDGPLTQRVFLAGAELAKIAGSMYFDAGAHAAAQRYYVLAVRMAKAADQDSFAAATLAALARQSYDLGNPTDGLEIIGMAQHGTRQAASPRLRAMLASREAWGHAQLGHIYAFHRAVDVAESSFADAGPLDTEPRWLSGLDAAELAGVIGARFRDLARHEPGQARHAVTYIGRALELRDPAKVRNRSFDLIGLARAHLITGDPEHASTLIGTALPTVTPGNPGRLGRKLADWSREATGFTSVPAVRAARGQVAELVGARPGV
ncbi:hypothetical protein [Pseudonocardia acaciae]|uniref:hypothetical protein n=1 Tax=Pseudonocardia acaciae TaxID=551276 RepID=UPI0006840D20|nr:hypothetical protein [Pseudonocardia acaciae]